MAKTIFQPGVKLANANITIPAYETDIGTIAGAMILRNNHSHVAFQVMGSEVAADPVTFVDINDGAHAALAAAAYVGNAGGVADFDVSTSSSAGTPVVVAVIATKVDTRTIRLNVDTEANDLVVLDYAVLGQAPVSPSVAYQGIDS